VNNSYLEVRCRLVEKGGAPPGAHRAGGMKTTLGSAGLVDSPTKGRICASAEERMDESFAEVARARRRWLPDQSKKTFRSPNCDHPFSQESRSPEKFILTSVGEGITLSSRSKRGKRWGTTQSSPLTAFGGNTTQLLKRTNNRGRGRAAVGRSTLSKSLKSEKFSASAAVQHWQEGRRRSNRT